MNLSYGTVILNPQKEKPVLQGHPWIFSGAIRKAPQEERPGMLVDVLDHQKKFVARGYYNPASQIRVRVLTRNEQEMITPEFIRKRIVSAVDRRANIFREGFTDCARLVAHEADGLPGLIVDRYGDWLSFQIVTAGMDHWRQVVIDTLNEHGRPTGIVERSDDAVREKEGLPLRTEVHRGGAWPESVQIKENGMALQIDIAKGHKTGFYLDQRDNRAVIRDYARGKRVLNCFSFTGGFAVSSLLGGATEVVNVDESGPALELAKASYKANGLSFKDESFVKADVFKYLRMCRDQKESFDFIILDPPKFVSQSSQIDRACRGYKDLNLIAMELLKPGGLLATFSCSGLIGRDLFQKVVFGASVDAKSEMQILKHLSQSECHPTLLTFPESLYLKGLLLRKL